MKTRTPLLGDIASVVTKGTTPTTLGRPFVEDGINFVKAESINADGGFIEEKLAKIDEETHELLARSQLQTGDILFSIAGVIGRTAIVPDELLPANTNQAIAIIRLDSPDVDRRFLFYQLRSKDFFHYSLGRVVQTAQANVSLGVLKAAPVQLPDVDVQRRVASLVGAYDNLIENNLRRIEILEGMAQAIYREWFLTLRFPGHENVGLTESSLGSLPDGWAVRCLGDYATKLVDGDWIETKDQGGSDYRLLQVSNIGIGSFRETGKYRFITSDTFERLGCTEINVGDLLISRMPDPIGRAWLVEHLEQPAVTAVDVAILTPPSKHAGLYLSQWLNSPATLAHAETVSTGTTRKRIPRSVLANISLVVPSEEILIRFADLVSPMQDLRTNLHRENEVLRKARDLLVPKLISGEIDVSELDIDTSWLAA